MIRAMEMHRQNGLVAQLRVLFALIMREMTTRFGRSSMGYFWALAEPAGFIALMSLVFSQLAHHPPYGRSFPLFYATGYLAFALYHEMARVTSRSVEVNRPLLSFPPVGALDAVLARAVLQLLTWGAATAIIFASILTVFAEPVHLRIGPLMQMVGLGALLGVGVGLCNTVLFAFSKSWELVFELVSRPLFLISAVFFSYDSLPLFAREILWWNPLVHLVGLMRQGFYPVYDGSYISSGYVLALALAFMVVGVVLVTRFGARLLET